MKFRDYIGEPKRKLVKNISKTKNIQKEKKKREVNYIGFDVEKKHLKRIHDYMKSWFFRYHINFKSINPYLTICSIDGKINNTIKSEENIIYRPKGIITVKKKNDKEYILLNYFFNNSVEREIIYNTDVEIINIYNNIKLFEIESNKMTYKMYDDMAYGILYFPSLELNIENIKMLIKEW